MKVDETYRNVNLIDNARQSTAGQKSEEQHASRARETDKPERAKSAEVALSNASREVAKAREAMEATQPDRAEKVAQIKEQVVDGSYKVDARQVADKMLGAAISDIV
jgi:negative regulator of flagellin synthesis FlgM